MADPKYRELTNKIFEKIKDKIYTDKLPSFNQLLAEFSVSQATLTSALDELEKKGLIVRKRRQGIFISKSRRKLKKNPKIDLILPNQGDSFFSETIAFAHKFLEKYHYRLVVSITEEDPEHEYELLNRSISDDSVGAIFMPLHETAKSVQALAELLKTKPVVQIDRRYWAAKTDFVAINSFSGSKLATQFLLKQHIEKIGFIRKKTILYSEQKRFDGYIDALTEAGIKTSTSWVFVLPDDFSDPCIMPSLKDFLNSSNTPRAFVAANSTMALVFLDAVKQLGYRVPENIKIISLDISAVSKKIKPALTHYSQPTHLIMQEAVKLIDSRINGDLSATKEILIDPVLIKGQTA